MTSRPRLGVVGLTGVVLALLLAPGGAPSVREVAAPSGQAQQPCVYLREPASNSTIPAGTQVVFRWWSCWTHASNASTLHFYVGSPTTSTSGIIHEHFTCPAGTSPSCRMESGPHGPFGVGTYTWAITHEFPGGYNYASPTWTFTVAAPPPPNVSRIAMSSVVYTSPSNPRAGQLFHAAVGAIIKSTQAPDRRIRSASIGCRATVRGRPIPVVRKGLDRRAAGARCTWRIPSSARGAPLKGVIRIRAEGLSATKGFRRVVR